MDKPSTEQVIEEAIVVPPTVPEDAPSEPHKGEPASASQPHAVYPDEDQGSCRRFRRFNGRSLFGRDV
jgi:hypothetical protein